MTQQSTLFWNADLELAFRATKLVAVERRLLPLQNRYELLMCTAGANVVKGLYSLSGRLYSISEGSGSHFLELIAAKVSFAASCLGQLYFKLCDLYARRFCRRHERHKLLLQIDYDAVELVQLWLNGFGLSTAPERLHQVRQLFRRANRGRRRADRGHGRAERVRHCVDAPVMGDLAAEERAKAYFLQQGWGWPPRGYPPNDRMTELAAKVRAVS